MYTAVLRSVCSYKFLEISLFGKKSIICHAASDNLLNLGPIRATILFSGFRLMDGAVWLV
ncbi:MAG: hypothetical protein LBJ16_01215 [Holosporaceae bacterium]|nr:hypothetical protein [Holosporaceae bacterium]